MAQSVIPTTPVGSQAAASAARRAAHSAKYRAQREARAHFREIARLLIKYRVDHGLTQEELARKVGTSHSQISRIESGRHQTSFWTLLRIAHALDLRMVVGFEGSDRQGKPRRELVAL